MCQHKHKQAGGSRLAVLKVIRHEEAACEGLECLLSAQSGCAHVTGVLATVARRSVQQTQSKTVMGQGHNWGVGGGGGGGAAVGRGGGGFIREKERKEFVPW